MSHALDPTVIFPLLGNSGTKQALHDGDGVGDPPYGEYYLKDSPFLDQGGQSVFPYVYILPYRSESLYASTIRDAGEEKDVEPHYSLLQKYLMPSVLEVPSHLYTSLRSPETTWAVH